MAKGTFPPSNVAFKLERVILYLENMDKNYLIWILSREIIACSFQCPDDLGKFNFLFCSHSGNLTYITVQKREKVGKVIYSLFLIPSLWAPKFI